MVNNKKEKNLVTICISRETRELLAAQGHKGQTYDTILREIIKQVHPDAFEKE